MKIIIGLGNPGEKYNDTRHNIGFAIIDKIKQEFNFPDFEFNKKFQAEVSKNSMAGIETLLVKPQTFMNMSGESVQAILDFYKLSPEDIIVIHDDLDIALGKYKIAKDSSSAGHNGVQNIIDKISTQKFKRLRVGVGEETAEGAIKCRLGAHPPRVDERSPRVEAGDFVLGRFSPEEEAQLEKTFSSILEELKNLL